MLLLLAIFAALVAGMRDDDAHLLARIANGDRAALHALYARASPRAMAIAMRLLKDRADAEDIVQETFVDLWKRAAQFNPERGAVIAWIVTMTRNRAVDRLRARQRSARTVESARHESALAAEPLPHETVGGATDRVRLIEALASLPVEQRQAIEMAYFDGLTQREIASATGEPLGTVKTRVRLGMSKLADLLATAKEGAA